MLGLFSAPLGLGRVVPGVIEMHLPSTDELRVCFTSVTGQSGFYGLLLVLVLEAGLRLNVNAVNQAPTRLIAPRSRPLQHAQLSATRGSAAAVFNSAHYGVAPCVFQG